MTMHRKRLRREIAKARKYAKARNPTEHEDTKTRRHEGEQPEVFSGMALDRARFLKCSLSRLRVFVFKILDDPRFHDVFEVEIADEAPGHVLTSMVKGVNTATFDVIRRVENHTFKGGIYSFGLKEGGVGYIYDDRNRALIPDSARARVEELKQEIIAGQIKVPSTR